MFKLFFSLLFLSGVVFAVSSIGFDFSKFPLDLGGFNGTLLNVSCNFSLNVTAYNYTSGSINDTNFSVSKVFDDSTLLSSFSNGKLVYSLTGSNVSSIILGLWNNSGAQDHQFNGFLQCVAFSKCDKCFFNLSFFSFVFHHDNETEVSISFNNSNPITVGNVSNFSDVLIKFDFSSQPRLNTSCTPRMITYNSTNSSSNVKNYTASVTYFEKPVCSKADRLNELYLIKTAKVCGIWRTKSFCQKIKRCTWNKPKKSCVLKK